MMRISRSDPLFAGPRWPRTAPRGKISDTSAAPFQDRAINQMRNNAMKNAFTKAVKWAKENPMTVHDTGIAEALLLARKWRNERDRLIRAICSIRSIRDPEVAKVKALAGRFDRPRKGNRGALTK